MREKLHLAESNLSPTWKIMNVDREICRRMKKIDWINNSKDKRKFFCVHYESRMLKCRDFLNDNQQKKYVRVICICKHTFFVNPTRSWKMELLRLDSEHKMGSNKKFFPSKLRYATHNSEIKIHWEKEKIGFGLCQQTNIQCMCVWGFILNFKFFSLFNETFPSLRT